MRLIEQVGALLAGIIAKQRAGRYSEAKVEIDKKARQTIGLSVAEVRRFSPEALADLLASSGGIRYARAVTLAELLLQDAKVSEATGQSTEALLSSVHAFCLLSDTVDVLSEEDQTVYREKLDALATQLGALPSHPYLNERLAAYHARRTPNDARPSQTTDS